MMKHFCLLVLLLFFVIELQVNAKEYEPPLYVQYVDEVTNTFLKEVYKKYGFECGATGGGMPHDVEKISVSLDANQTATVEQARELEINLTERFAQIINAHEKIRPFLREYPFPAGRVSVMISFRVSKKKKESFKDDEVELVFQAKNRIFYQAYNYEKPYLGIDIKDEPYEEALKIVQGKQEQNDQK